jgi:hypothetical protein
MAVLQNVAAVSVVAVVAGAADSEAVLPAVAVATDTLVATVVVSAGSLTAATGGHRTTAAAGPGRTTIENAGILREGRTTAATRAAVTIVIGVQDADTDFFFFTS